MVPSEGKGDQSRYPGDPSLNLLSHSVSSLLAPCLCFSGFIPATELGKLLEGAPPKYSLVFAYLEIDKGHLEVWLRATCDSELLLAWIDEPQDWFS